MTKHYRLLADYALAPTAVFNSDAELGDLTMVEILSDVWDGFVTVKATDGQIATVAIHELLYA